MAASGEDCQLLTADDPQETPIVSVVNGRFLERSGAVGFGALTTDYSAT